MKDDVASILHASMEEHCWGAIADVAGELQVWATELKEACSADVSAQLADFMRRVLEFKRQRGVSSEQGKRCGIVAEHAIAI